MITYGDIKLSHPIWNKITNEAKDLISKMLIVESKYRYSASEVLNH
jgi:serine/threonine protein kinase